MTPRISRAKLGQRRQTQVVAKRSSEAVATAGHTLKLLLWAGFFVMIFTVQAHVGIRTASLRLQSNRLQAEVEDLREGQRRLRHEIAALESGLSETMGADIEEALSFAEYAQRHLGMISPLEGEHLVVDAALIAEVAEESVLWRVEPSAPATDVAQATEAGWIEILAGHLAGLESHG